METQEAKKYPAKKPSALKRDQQAERRRVANRIFKSRVKSELRKFDGALKEKEQAKVDDLLKSIYSLADKGVKKGIFKRNKASRIKERASLKISALA